jgi:MFS family permease
VVYLSAAAMFIMSVTGAIGNVECGTYLTEKIADNMIGKVTGISYTITIGACAFGPVIGGCTDQYLGVHWAVSVLCAIVMLMTLGSLHVLKEPYRRIPVETESTSLSTECSPDEQSESPNLASVPDPSPNRNDADEAGDLQDVAMGYGFDSV